MKVLVLTPIYPGNEIPKTTTRVVHYFAHEWIKMGVDVRVIHYPSNFPEILNLAAKFIKSHLDDKMRIWNLDECEYSIEGVRVKRIPMKKYYPHTRYSRKQIASAFSKTIDYLEKEQFAPDVISSHWINPQYELMHLLKAHYGCRTCYVAHDPGRDFLTIYRKEADQYIAETDIIGYRSHAIKRKFETRFECEDKPHFLCYSGIPTDYILSVERKIDNVNTFIHVSTLIKRKYPSLIIPAVYKAFGNKEYIITYIGADNESDEIIHVSKRLGVADKVRMLGRLNRDEIIHYLDSCSVFIMISHTEAFGLVYLEAMARGCIVIASRDEGFDGIIRDGENGFLCKAGDVDELALIISRLKNMPQEEWQRISHEAISTARGLTDEKAAKVYLNNLTNL